ncbi:uncharacterized protein CEXT_800141 [Caerostris extrusa]|uniref:Uncharacterized protein n=1 Tax=Caerostris extrusa TaxID=172846 RepID=A0AAV4TP47_CAEEX|nr:uncharacterized protein CEXT_800141 [Caerostris extrusa]
MDLGERGFDMDNTDAIPYLSEEESLIYNSYPKQQSQRMMSRMSGHWLDSGSRNDLYDFVPESQDKLLSLSGSLPVADEVIVPLDWEEKDSKKKGKRNIFTSRGWGGASYSKEAPTIRKVNIPPNTNSYFTANPVQERTALRRRERESEDSRSLQGGEESQNSPADPRVSSQESWAIPRQYWSIPHLI